MYIKIKHKFEGLLRDLNLNNVISGKRKRDLKVKKNLQ